jgi:fermentation-respiration switch protein FrsA (DUF1100 family)
MKRHQMVRILVYLVIGGLLLIAYVKYMELRGIFFPSQKIEATPAAVEISFEDVYVKTADGEMLHGWFIPHAEVYFTLLFFHGNAGNIGHRVEKIAMLREIGLNIYIIDYRGYGRSTGRPSERGLYRDAEAAYGYLVSERKILPERIILYGESIGSAVAVDLASRHPVGGVILEGGFSSGRDIAGRIYPFIPPFLVSDIFNSLLKIPMVQSPKLFLHSRQDEVVPFSLAKKLFDAAVPPKTLVELQGGHNTSFIDSSRTYLSAIFSFIQSLVTTKAKG